MSKTTRPRQVDRHTAFACLSVPADKIGREHKGTIIAAFKQRGWGVLADERRYRFIHFDQRTSTDVSSILDSLDCDKADWSAYHLRFPTVEATKAIVDSADWK